jgi:hypothetical protein
MFTLDAVDKRFDAVLAGPCTTIVIANRGKEAVCPHVGTTLEAMASLQEGEVLGGGEEMLMGG